MVETIQINQLFEHAHIPIVDVRSPIEFTKGHIPAALNMPLFTDTERAEVGTLYKQAGKETAIEKGLEYVGSKMPEFVRNAKRLAPNRELIIHCWRGGKRSQSMAWLLDLAGFKVKVLDGGYKVYRQQVLHQIDHLKTNLIVLGGKTGCGKTHLLHALEKAGEQIIDLEGLAHHKGSAFGWIGESNQPTTEQFENNLFEASRLLDWSKRIWVENESKGIGTVWIPQGFWDKMKSAPLINIELPQAQRVQHLIGVYSKESKDDLIQSFEKIGKRIGGNNLKEAKEAVMQGDYKTATEKALYYYDKTYQFNLEKNKSPNIKMITFESYDFEKNAQYLIDFCNDNKL